MRRGMQVRTPYLGTILELTPTRALVWWHPLDSESNQPSDDYEFTVADEQHILDHGTWEENLQWHSRHVVQSWLD